MTIAGGINNMGTIFKIMPDGTGCVKLLDFAGATKGSYPWESLISDGAFLYGMTRLGGTNNLGVVFKYCIPLSSTATNTGAYCAGATIQLNSTDGSNYLWSGPLSYIDSTQNPTIASSTTGMSGTYTVTVTNVGGCTSTSTTTVVVNACTGIEDAAVNWNLQVYPNPGNGIFTLSFSEMPVGTSEIRLITILGEVIYSGILQTQTQQLDFSHLPAATYYFQIKNLEGTQTKQVIIKP